MQALEMVPVGVETPTDPPAFAAEGGEIGALIRSVDWAQTPLGPVEGWSAALRMMVGFMLANRLPLLLWWGPQYVSIYNDAYRPILGAKHPWAMGQPVSVCWSEMRWSERNGPRVVPRRRRGFGSRLIERGIAQDLDGEVRLDFDPRGVQCSIRLPVSDRVSIS